ncbi:MAG TPA: rRNA adenine N(6)-methyltransferase family protein [Dehalococcoidia bacterium]|nr:rRNA adenine N(6)-methyltransferase family protein [Dehalococcoidia bacterium]
MHRATTYRSRRPELSQHFLCPRAARDVVGRLRLPPGMLVFEPGAGAGALTARLADAGFRVIAVERDPRLFRSLRARLIGRANVECHLGDALSYPWPREAHAVVSNVPYAVTAALVRRVLAGAATEAALIVQREAAAKFAGSPHETLFSLVHRPWFDISIVHAMRRTDFIPPPSVESVVLRIRRRDTPLLPSGARPRWHAFVRAGIGASDVRSATRDALTWRQIARLERELGFSRHARPSRLGFEQWLALFEFAEGESCERGRRRARGAGIRVAG